MQIFIINGFPGVGKDEFVKNCIEILGSDKCFNISTVDFLKEIATICGWDGKKTGKSRKFLSDLKDLLTIYNDIPYKRVLDKVGEIIACNKNVEAIFIHCREPKEIARLQEELNAKSILIRREAAENSEYTNHADSEVLNHDYDYELHNDGSLDDLRSTAITFLNDVKIKYKGDKI
jgi:tRNA uridine 5-carbamoylmethylation protein Kti12